jgi:hypothetical protein
MRALALAALLSGCVGGGEYVVVPGQREAYEAFRRECLAHINSNFAGYECNVRAENLGLVVWRAK